MFKQIINNATSVIISPWNNFWFKPISTRPLGIFRLFFGLIVIQYALLLIPDIFIWLGKDGIISSSSINEWQPSIRLNVLNVFPGNDLWLSIIFLIFLIAAVFLTAGFLTPTSTIIVFLCILSFHARNYLIINSGDTVMRLLSFWLIFAPAGGSFSIDHFRGRIRQTSLKIPRFNIDKEEAEPWAQRLMQINVSLVYVQTFFKKIEGIDWLNGTAVYYSSHLIEMQHLPMSYIFDHLWTIQLLTWTTLIIEFSLGFLIWFKPIRYYVIACGVIMHLIIDWSMLIPQFEWVMIVSYILFIEPNDLERLLKWFFRYFFRLSEKNSFQLHTDQSLF